MRRWRMCLLWQDGGDAGAGGGDAGASDAGAASAAADAPGNSGAAPAVDSGDVDALVEHAARLAGPAPTDDGQLKPQRTPRAQRGPGGRFAGKAGAEGQAEGQSAALPQQSAVGEVPPAAVPAAHEALTRLGVDLPEGTSAELAGRIDTALGRWYAERYEPVARQVLDEHRAVETQRAELEAFTQTEHYKVGAQLANDPQLYAAVQQYLNGGGGQNPPALAGGLAGIDPSQLDETGQALYASLAQTTQQMQALRAQHQETQAALREVREWVTTRDQADAQAHEQHVQTETARGLQSAIAEASRQFGFDVRAYKPQFKEALSYATQHVEAALWRWEQSGSRGPRPQFDVGQLLKEGFKRAGFEQLQQQRKRQAATAAAAPGGRAPRGVGRGATLTELVDYGVEAAEQFDAAR